MFFEEIRAGREEGGIQMQEVEALNSGKNQTVKIYYFANLRRSNVGVQSIGGPPGGRASYPYIAIHVWELFSSDTSSYAHAHPIDFINPDCHVLMEKVHEALCSDSASRNCADSEDKILACGA